jgi:hypothetical protein
VLKRNIGDVTYQNDKVIKDSLLELSIPAKFLTFDEHIGTITIAALSDEYSKSTVHMGISYCSKRDSFKRSLGRTIAEGRLAKNPYTHYGQSENINDNIKSFIQKLQEDRSFRNSVLSCIRKGNKVPF